MKKLLMLFALTFVLFSCTKDAVEPDLASDINGTYSVYNLSVGSTKLTLPVAGISMIIEISKVSNTKVNYVMTINDNGTKDTSSGEFDLEKEDTKTIILEDGKEIGFVSGTLMEFTTIADGEVISIKAKK